MVGFSSEPSPELLPWNRRQRRRHQRSRGLVIHLFSGADTGRWKGTLPDDMDWIFLDLELGDGFNVHNANVWSYVCSLARSGKVKGVVGGPPCRTTSRLRCKGPPGPRRVRGRGDDRWGLEGLTAREREQVRGDSALVVKQVGLWHLADHPSFFEWPLLRRMVEEYGMSLVSFDQGRTGHSRRKPTSLLTNLRHLEDLDGLRGGGSADPVEGGLQERMKASRSWARWSSGLVKAIGLALNLRFGGRAHIGLAKMDVEEWKRHIKQEHVPYRRDCRDCVEAMGFSSPHRRSRNASSAFVMAVDIMGPFEQGRDLGLNQWCKYVMVATIPVPIVKDLAGAPEEPLDHEAEVKNVVEIEEEKEEVELATEEQVAELNMKAALERAQEEVPLQNLTIAEPMQSRAVEDIAQALSKVHAHYRMLGVRPCRLHSDREKSFLTKAVAKWVQAREMVHTMTSGDDSQSNGRVEAELLQLKRRMRLLLHTSKVEASLWPCALRHAATQRLRLQLQRLGVGSKPMVNFGSMVMAKAKRWHHKTGELTNPFKRVQVLGPSPLMSSGWVAKDKQNRIQHLRTVVTPSKTLEAVLELQEVDLKDKGIRHRLTGKQSFDPHPLKDVVARHFDAGVRPALRVLRAGGETTEPILENPESTPLNSLSVWQPGEDVNGMMDSTDQSMEQMVGGDGEEEVVGVELEVSGPLRNYLEELERDFSGGGLEFVDDEEDVEEVVDEMEPESEGEQSGWRAWECLGELAMVCCGDCGLLQPRHPHQVPTEDPRDIRGCGVVMSSMQAAVEGTLDLVEATQISCGFCGGNLEYVDDYRERRTGGLWKGSSCSWDQAEEWHAMEVRSHLLMKRLWSEELRHQAIGEEQGRQRGRWMAALEAGLLVQEDHLEDQHRKLESVRLAAVKNEAGLELQDPGAPPPAVLQTYAVPLQRVRQELAAWVPPMTDEYQSLIEGTRALSPTTMEELEQDPLYEVMEVAPGMLVPTIKAPHGKKRARIVVCGNRLEALDGSGAATSGKEEAQNLYAGGADGTTIRCLLRKAAAMNWEIATCDVKTAFLLAPREDSSRRLVVVKPPRILVEAGIVGPQELWRVQHALYGLRSSPADWATYRNRLMRSFQWQHEGRTLELRETPEPNLWKIVERRPLDQEEPPPKGFIGVYVDDFMVVGAKDIVKGALSRIEMEWKCSPAEWVNSERWTKFSGFELRWSSAEEDSGLYVGQQAYIQELLSRHSWVTPATVPFPGVPNEEPEAEVTLEDVRKAQGVVGELLWVSVRSRPDLACLDGKTGDPSSKAGLGVWMSDVGTFENHLGMVVSLWTSPVFNPWGALQSYNEGGRPFRRIVWTSFWKRVSGRDWNLWGRAGPMGIQAASVLHAVECRGRAAGVHKSDDHGGFLGGIDQCSGRNRRWNRNRVPFGGRQPSWSSNP